MSRKIAVCPDCDSASIFPRSGRHNGKPGWKCTDCDELKDTVRYRDRKMPHMAGKGTLARKLMDMDAEDL